MASEKELLQLMNRKWSIIPVGRDKKPLVDWAQFQEQALTQEQILKWSKRWPGCNWAVVTGKVSGLVVIDVDSSEGEEALKGHWKGETLTCKTAKGRHFYFRHPGYPVANSVRLLPGVDIRADGGYVVVPPSIHESGHTYTWENPSAPIIDLPEALLEKARKDQKSRMAPEDFETPLAEGNRNEELTRRVGKLFQQGHTAPTVLSMVKGLNADLCKPPLLEAEVKAIVKSIADREVGKTGKPSDQEFKATSNREMFMKYGASEVSWTIQDWLPEGTIGFVVAPPGSWKTWMMLNLAFAINTGGDFLGQFPVNKKGPVLIIQQEDTFTMLMGRIACMFNSKEPIAKTLKDGDILFELDGRYVEEMLDMPIYWHEDRELNLEDAKCIDRVEKAIEELKPALVIIDPLYSAISVKDYMAEGAQKMLALKKLRDRYGCSFMIAHHTTKAAAKGEGERSGLWGNQFLNALLETGWQIREGDDESTVKIKRHFKDNPTPSRVQAAFNVTHFSFQVDISKIKDSASEIIKEAILEGQQLRSARAMANVAGCSKSTAHDVMKKLRLKKGEDGCYQLPK